MSVAWKSSLRPELFSDWKCLKTRTKEGQQGRSMPIAFSVV